MIDVVPFNPIHLRFLDLQSEQSAIGILFDNLQYQNLLLDGPGQTILGQSDIVACVGIFRLTSYSGQAWALLSQHVRPYMVELTRHVRRELRRCKFVRVETSVKRDYKNGHRWCRLLGMVNETPDRGMKYYGPNGETHDLYAFYPGDAQNEET